MPSNPKTSPWYNTPRAKRKRKGLLVYLSDEAKARLELLVGPGMRSAFIEKLIMDAPLPESKE